MKLNTRNVTTPNTSEDFYRDGELFVRRGKIIGLKVSYGAQNRFGRERDVILHVTLQSNDMQHEVEIDGNYRRDEQGQLTGWGGVFKIALLLESCGISTETDDAGHIPADALRQLAHREVAFLSVPYQKREDGRYKRYVYPILLGFTDPTTGQELGFEDVARQLIARFKYDNYAFGRYQELTQEAASSESSDTAEVIDLSSEGDEIPF